MTKMTVTMVQTSKAVSHIRWPLANRTILNANRARNVCPSHGCVTAIMTVAMVATRKAVIRKNGMKNTKLDSKNVENMPRI